MDLKLNLAWDSYQKSICNGLGLLQQRGEFVDMTLAADGHQVKVHQMILSLVSPYIKELITSAQCQHPIIFLNQVSYQTLQLILEYAYSGEVLVARDQLPEFLEAGRALHIRGLENQCITSNTNGLHIIGETIAQESVKENQKQGTPHTGTKIKIDLPERDDETDYEEVHTNYEVLDMDDDHLSGNDETMQTKQSFVSEIKEAPRPNLNSSSLLQYTLSCQGSIQLVLNRYIYRMRHTRRKNERVWRCITYDNVDKQQRGTMSCRAMVVTRDKAVIERGGSHNHPFHDKQILKKVREGNMFTAYNMAESIAMTNVLKKKSSEKSITEETNKKN